MKTLQFKVYLRETDELYSEHRTLQEAILFCKITTADAYVVDTAQLHSGESKVFRNYRSDLWLVFT